MIVVLRSYNSVWRFAKLDTQTGAFGRMPLWLTLLRKPASSAGWYNKVTSGLAALYVEHGELWFSLNRKRIRIDDQTVANLERVHSINRLRLSRGGMIVDMQYHLPRLWPPLSEDMTPNIDEEDWDFGLFVYRIATDPARRKLALEHRASET